MLPPSVVVFNIVGVLSWIVALYLGDTALTATTVVSAPDAGLPALQGVVNLQLMQNQMIGIIEAGTLAVVGTLCLGFSAVIANLVRPPKENLTSRQP